MADYFYAHIVNPQDIHMVLDALDVSSEEKEHLRDILESSLHHHIVDLILSELPDEHKHSFLIHLTDDNHDAMWTLVKETIENPEEKIRLSLEDFKQEILNDIKEAHLEAVLSEHIGDE